MDEASSEFALVPVSLKLFVSSAFISRQGGLKKIHLTHME